MRYFEKQLNDLFSFGYIDLLSLINSFCVCAPHECLWPNTSRNIQWGGESCLNVQSGFIKIGHFRVVSYHQSYVIRNEAYPLF